MGQLRLFWAINLPEEHKLKLSRIQASLLQCGPDAKWVEYRNLHLTVKFLGETDPSMVKAITASVSQRLKLYRGFILNLEGLGFFPNSANPRVLWAGLKGEVAALKGIAGVVDHCMAEYGFAMEVRRFSPHLTLARLKSSTNKDKLIKGMEAEEPRVKALGDFNVFSVDLMQSQLSRLGPSYTCLASVKLNQ